MYINKAQSKKQITNKSNYKKNTSTIFMQYLIIMQIQYTIMREEYCKSEREMRPLGVGLGVGGRTIPTPHRTNSTVRARN